MEDNHFANSGSISVPLIKEECTITLTVGGNVVPGPSGGDPARRIEPGVAVGRGRYVCIREIRTGTVIGVRRSAWLTEFVEVSPLGGGVQARSSGVNVYSAVILGTDLESGHRILQYGARRGAELAVEANRDGSSSIGVIHPNDRSDRCLKAKLAEANSARLSKR